MCTYGYTGPRAGPIAAVIAGRMTTASSWPRSLTRLPPCLPTAIDAPRRWSIAGVNVREGGGSITSASTASCATIGCCFSGTPGDRSNTRSRDGRIAVSESNRRWCSDGFEIACDNRERVRVAFALDCCDREAMSWVATTGGISGHMVRDLMVEAIESRFDDVEPAQPIEWLTDNASPYIARHTRSFAREIGLEPVTTAIRSPQSNGMAEAFVKTFKRDYVERMDRSDAVTVMRQLSAAFSHYNDVHPHSALKMLSPRMFRRHSAQLGVSACPEK
jgi:transposase InsO family protein